MMRLVEWIYFEEIACLYRFVFMEKQETFQKSLHNFVNFFATRVRHCSVLCCVNHVFWISFHNFQWVVVDFVIFCLLYQWIQVLWIIDGFK